MKLGIKTIEFTSAKNLSLPFFKDNEAITSGVENTTFETLSTTHLSGTLEETSERDKNGIVRTVTVTGIVVDATDGMRRRLRELETGHAFLVEDMNGVKYLVGTNVFRAQSTYRKEIDKLGKNVFEVEIVCKSPHGALRIATPALPAPDDYYFRFWKRKYNVGSDMTLIETDTINIIAGTNDYENNWVFVACWDVARRPMITRCITPLPECVRLLNINPADDTFGHDFLSGDPNHITQSITVNLYPQAQAGAFTLDFQSDDGVAVKRLTVNFEEFE